MTTIDEILQGRDLYVVLENRMGRKYVESYNLSTIVLFEDKYWGKFRNNHAPMGHDQINPLHCLSYIYNNFCDVVCNMSLSMGVQRYCFASSYANLEFFVKGEYERIWDDKNKGNIALMEELVRAAVPMKVIIKARDGFTYITPVHTIEVYDDGESFGIDTEYDGFPDRIRNFGEIFELNSRLQEVANKSPPEAYIATNYQTGTAFFLTSFMVNNNAICHRKINGAGQLVNDIFEFESVAVYAQMRN